MELTYVNLIMAALNFILFTCQVAAVKYLLDLVSRVSYNEKKAVEQLTEARAREAEARREYEAYRDKLDLLNKAESIAALINEKKTE